MLMTGSKKEEDVGRKAKQAEPAGEKDFNSIDANKKRKRHN